jgi:hypothetical protein
VLCSAWCLGERVCSARHGERVWCERVCCAQHGVGVLCSLGERVCCSQHGDHMILVEHS